MKAERINSKKADGAKQAKKKRTSPKTTGTSAANRATLRAWKRTYENRGRKPDEGPR